MIEFAIPIALRPTNKSRGAHWSKKHADTTNLELFICAALDPKVRQAWNLIEAEEGRQDNYGKWRIHRTKRKQRRRVSVVLVMPSVRRLLLDDDNLLFSVKPLNDALVRLGLLTDDKREWLELEPTRQEVSVDGSERTIIRIEVLG